MTGNKPHGIVIQERDRHLLRELAIMRIIDREQAKLVAGFGSTTQANVRLLELTKARLLRRYNIGTNAGGKKALYALSPTGAKLVQVPMRGPRRKQDEVLVADFFVTHQLAINDVYCTLKYRPIPTPDAKFIRWLSFFKPIDGASTLIPDGYVEVSGAIKTFAAFLEVDLGHEGQKVWKAKIQAYLRYAVSGEFQNQFHEPRFRVLVITNLDPRTESIRRLVSSFTDKVFWVSSFNTINRDGFWSPIWFRPTGNERQSLL